jgi:hypothetical protein
MTVVNVVYVGGAVLHTAWGRTLQGVISVPDGRIYMALAAHISCEIIGQSIYANAYTPNMYVLSLIQHNHFLHVLCVIGYARIRAAS